MQEDCAVPKQHDESAWAHPIYTQKQPEHVMLFVQNHTQVAVLADTAVLSPGFGRAPPECVALHVGRMRRRQHCTSLAFASCLCCVSVELGLFVPSSNPPGCVSTPSGMQLCNGFHRLTGLVYVVGVYELNSSVPSGLPCHLVLWLSQSYRCLEAAVAWSGVGGMICLQLHMGALSAR